MSDNTIELLKAAIDAATGLEERVTSLEKQLAALTESNKSETVSEKIRNLKSHEYKRENMPLPVFIVGDIDCWVQYPETRYEPPVRLYYYADYEVKFYMADGTAYTFKPNNRIWTYVKAYVGDPTDELWQPIGHYIASVVHLQD